MQGKHANWQKHRHNPADLERVLWFCSFCVPYTWPAPVHCLPPSLFITRLIHQLSSAFDPSLKGCVAAIHLRQLATSEKNTATHAEATYCLCGNVARCIQITDVKVKIKKLQFSFWISNCGSARCCSWCHFKTKFIMAGTLFEVLGSKSVHHSLGLCWGLLGDFYVFQTTRSLGCDFTNNGMCEISSSVFLLSFKVWRLTLPPAFYFLYPFIKRSFLREKKFISCTEGGGYQGTENMHTPHNKHTHSCQKPASSTLRDRNTKMPASAGWALEGNKEQKSLNKRDCKQSTFITRLRVLMELTLVPIDTRIKTLSFVTATIAQNAAKDVQLT